MPEHDVGDSPPPATDTAESSSSAHSASFHLAANLIVLDAAINGVPKRMILDTGAAATIVGSETAAELGLIGAGKCRATGAGGDVELTSVNVASLSVAGVTRQDFRAMTMDLAAVCERIGQGVDGILGFDFLSGFRLTVDYPARRLTLEESSGRNPD